MWSPRAHWRIKALLQTICATLPAGDRIYYQFQRRIGNLRRPDFQMKLGYQCSLVHTLRRHGVDTEGAEMFEIGTGWVPLTAIGFWVCGAKGVVTGDIRRHLSIDLTRDLLQWMSEHQAELKELWKGAAVPERVAERLALIARLRDDPVGLLREANIDYRAPADATRTGLPDRSIDVHFSYNVLEHVPPAVIERMLAEARRVLRPGGVTLHYVDPTDHFSHFDRALSEVHFLRYETEEWEAVAGNRYSYTNRLRDQDYRAIFAQHDLGLKEARYDVDQRSVAALRTGFPLARQFRDRCPEELCRRNLVYVAEAGMQGER